MRTSFQALFLFMFQYTLYDRPSMAEEYKIASFSMLYNKWELLQVGTEVVNEELNKCQTTRTTRIHPPVHYLHRLSFFRLKKKYYSISYLKSDLEPDLSY